MLRILTLLIGLLASVSAYAQAPAITELPPLSGTAIGSGYDMANGTLYIPTSTSLQNAQALPFSISLIAITPFIPTATANFLGNGGVVGQGFSFLSRNPPIAQDSWRVQTIIRPGSAAALCDQGASGVMCATIFRDQTRHHYCAVYTPNHSWFYIDGILTDENLSIGTITATTNIWTIGLAGSAAWQAGTVFYDERFYTKALTADDCVYISRLNQAKLISNSGPTSTDMVLHLALNDCTITGALYTCPDTSGHNNNATNDKAPPVIVVTAPCTVSCGVSGAAVTMQATCTDPGGPTCVEVCYMVDGAVVSSPCPTTAPYTFSWNSTKIIDGAHALTAGAVNQAAVAGVSASVALSITNSVAAKTVQVNSSAGLDTNPCTVSQPCLTLAHIQSAISLLGGDTLQIVGSFTDSAPFKLCAALVAGCTQNFFPSNATLTVTTTGGGCNPFTLTTTGCGVINVTGANDGIDILNGGNVTVTNLGVIGNTSALTGHYGIYAASTLPAFTTLTGITITNNYTKDFEEEIYVLSTATNAPYTGYVISNNVATNTTHINPGSLTCIIAAGNTQGTVQGNLATQCGGGFHNNGNGIFVRNYPSPVGAPVTLFQFNVVHDFGWNDLSSQGGPVGCYVSFADKVTTQFNECYNGIPNPATAPPPLYGGAIDYDCFDIDVGSTNVIEQYNYAHNCPVQAAYNIIVNPAINPNWNTNVLRYNIAENYEVCISVGGTNVNTQSFVYNNSCASNTNRVLPYDFPTCWSNGVNTDIIIANNLCVYTGTTQADWISFLTPTSGNAFNNDYWAPSPAPAPTWVFNAFGTSTVRYTSLSSYQAASIAALPPNGLDKNSLNVDPMLAGTPATGGTCWGGGTSHPAGPQNAPSAGCPSVYKLTTGSPLIGAGADLTQAPFNQNVGSVDYFGASIPNALCGAGSGYNIGADGACH